MQNSRERIGIEDHHPHSCGRGDVSGIVHVKHGNGSKSRIRRIEKDDGGNRRHGIDEEVDRDVQNGRHTDRNRDAREHLVERLFEGLRNRLELHIHLLQRSNGSQVGNRIEVRDRADDEDRHAAVEEMKRIAGIVEEKDVGKSQNQPGNRHRHHGEQLKGGTPSAEAPPLLHHVGAYEDDDRAEDRRVEGHAYGIPVGIPSAAVHHIEIVVLKAQLQIVGPELDQRGVLAHTQHAQDEKGNQDTVAKHEGIEPPIHLWLVSDGSSGQEGHLTLLHHPIDEKCDHRRDQEDHTYDCAHLKILLADNLLIDVHREDIELAADDLRGAEVRNDQRKDHKGRRNKTVARARQGDREEDPRPGSLERKRRLIESGVSDRKRGDDNDQGMRKGEEYFGDDNPDGSIDRMPHQEFSNHALVAEKVDESDSR